MRDNCHPLVMSGVVTEDNGEDRSSQKQLASVFRLSFVSIDLEYRPR